MVLDVVQFYRCNMLIVYISSSNFPSTQANNVHVTSMCNAIFNTGNKVVLLAYAIDELPLELIKSNIYSDYGLNKGIEIALIKRRSNRAFSYLSGIKIANKIAKIGPDIIIGRNLTGTFFSRKYCKNIFLEVHQPVLFGLGLQFFLFKKLLKHKNFTRLIVISNPLKWHFISSGVSDDEIIVLPDGASVPSGKMVSIDSILNTSRLKIGYFGSLYSGRGVELILELARLIPEMDFYIYGGNIDQINGLKSLSCDIDNLNLRGHIPFSKVQDEMQEMHILVAPYQRQVGLASGDITTENWMSPLKIFEYMSVERAIICSNIPVLHEVLTDGVNCLLCLPDDIDAWKLALKGLDLNRAELSRLAKRGRLDLIEKYSWENRWQRIYELIK
jgi:glycosyltransferase involved in cell wall biosynthesis